MNKARMKKLIRYAEQLNNINVEFFDHRKENESFAYYESYTNTIKISKWLNYKKQIICLLHELGHAYLFLVVHDRAYDHYFQNVKEDYLLTKKNEKIDLIREEVLAWNYGYFTVARQLDLKISWKEYSNCMYQYLSTYLREVKI